MIPVWYERYVQFLWLACSWLAVVLHGSKILDVRLCKDDEFGNCCRVKQLSSNQQLFFIFTLAWSSETVVRRSYTGIWARGGGLTQPPPV
jgi:hypothetical protein